MKREIQYKSPVSQDCVPQDPQERKSWIYEKEREMFPNHYGHVSRVPVTGSSFYIRDILGNSDSGYSESQSKIYSYDSGNYLTNYSTSSMLTYPQLGYPGPSYRGNQIKYDTTNQMLHLLLYRVPTFIV